MTGSELKDALMDERRVLNNGIEYEKVSAIIYRKNGGKISVSAELLDKNKSCIVIAAADKIENCEV